MDEWQIEEMGKNRPRSSVQPDVENGLQLSVRQREIEADRKKDSG
jgi:hypothetical protein